MQPAARPQVYPERMAVLPPPVFQTLVSTLQFGVGATGDDEVTQASARLLGTPGRCLVVWSSLMEAVAASWAGGKRRSIFLRPACWSGAR